MSWRPVWETECIPVTRQKLIFWNLLLSFPVILPFPELRAQRASAHDWAGCSPHRSALAAPGWRCLAPEVDVIGPGKPTRLGSQRLTPRSRSPFRRSGALWRPRWHCKAALGSASERTLRRRGRVWGKCPAMRYVGPLRRWAIPPVWGSQSPI